MPITGAHVLLFSPEAEALRATLRDVLGWDFVEAHPGWLIFGLPPAELGVHPSDGDSRHELWLICDDEMIPYYQARGFALALKPEFPEPLAALYRAKREWPDGGDHNHNAMVWRRVGFARVNRLSSAHPRANAAAPMMTLGCSSFSTSIR